MVRISVSPCKSGFMSHSLVISTLLYGAESWPLSVTQMKKLEAAHHKFQRRLLRWGSHGGTRSEMKTSERKLVQGNWKI